MSKYLTILRIGIQEAFEYRSEIFIYMIGWSVRFMISMFLFLALFEHQSQIGTYNQNNIVLYFVLVQILTAFNFARTGMYVSDDIQTGDFSNFLVKPISFTLYYLFFEMSKNVVRFIISFGVFGIILIFLKPDFFSIGLLKILPIAIISALLANLISSLLSMGIGILAFWIVNARRIIFMYFAIMSIFSGMMIPISLFPENMQKIISLTPFPYILYEPVQILLGQYSAEKSLKIVGIQIMFVIALFLIIRIAYFFGVKKYEAVGR